ncbi:RNA-binding protein 12B [Sorex araneus]|uniref:RNA-binding protein 12B n=1 Tax=Sorex araneus TaxID=42254 RepID=UPI0024334506|nr:RNA-binding protein 12B [Sorex araneus]XP_054981452.1 RNA-binding protein 12B [Sorex araneus]XP_054981453.1 RNA-binding protein 12B [Sorex araneus]
MAVVIRLLGLPLFAAPVDIRRFFTGLTIPDGGVHIIGGDMGEAFIIFATDEDARRAVSRSGGFIMDSSVELFLSSKAEMQKTIEMKRTDCIGRERPGSGTTGIGSLSNVEAIKEEAGNSGYVSPLNRDTGFHTNGTGHGDLKPRKTRPSKAENPYLFLRGLPYLVNEEDVRVFFAGLWVDGVIFLKHHDGRNNGDAIVKFASCIDASGGLKCHRSFMGSRFIEVMQGSEQQWIEFGGNANKEGNIPARTDEHSPPRGTNDRHSRKRSHSKSPRRARSLSPQGYYVQLKNLSLSVNKRDLKNFFRDTDLSNEQIRFLYKDERRTRNAFVVFKTLRDYNTARGLHKTVLQYRPVYIDPVSRKDVLKLIKFYEKKRPASSIEKERLEHGSQKYCQEGYSGQKLCIYIRNFPFDVTKIEVQKFFADFSLAEDDIYLLYDDKGVGLGEALVKFKSEEQAMKAERLNRRRFLGTEVLLRLISEAQMQEFGVNFPVMASERMQDRSQSRDRDDYFHSFESDDPPMYSVGPSENFRSQQEDLRQPDNFKHPQGDFRQRDRYPPKDFRHSPEDFSYSSEEFRCPREEHFRRLPEEDFRHPREESFGHHWEDDWRRPPEEDFRQSSEEDWRRPAEGDFRRPEESFRRPPKEDFRHLAEEEFRHSPEEDFRHSPKEDYKRPSQEHFRRPPPEHFRRPPQQHFRRPPQEHFRRPPQEHFQRPSQEHFRRPPQDHFRRPHQEHFRRSREENFRHPSDEDYRGRPDEDFRHPPDEDFRSPPEEDFRRLSDEDFRRLPEEDVRDALEDDVRLTDNFRSHRSVANVGRPEGGKFDFGKRNIGSFPEGRFVPDPKLNSSSGRVTPIKIMNLPFKANVNEILDFFHGYRIIPDSVSIQYNEQGLPIGEAIVAMANYNEAMAAIKDLNDRPVGSRKVKLVLL